MTAIGNGFVELDRRGRDEPLDGLEPHVARDAEQEHGAGVAAQHFDLPGAEGEARVAGRGVVANA